MSEPRDPYNRIVSASNKGVGVRLTWQEVIDMSLDDAIATRAAYLRGETWMIIDVPGSRNARQTARKQNKNCKKSEQV